METCHVVNTDFHARIGEDPRYPAEAGRYHLFTAKICPYAHRTEIVRRLEGLEGVVGLTLADPVQTELGWHLSDYYVGRDGVENPVADVERIPELYAMSAPGFSGRGSVPVLWDTRTCTVVNNESAEIIVQLDAAFDGLRGSGAPALDLYPESLRGAIDDWAAGFDPTFCSALYKAGFAREQATYERWFGVVFDALDRLEERLSDGRPFVMGDGLTLADVRAFPHLVRFDPVYYALYRLNLRHLWEYEHIRAYMRRLWALPAFRESTDLYEAQRGYYLSWNQPSPLGCVPAGGRFDWG